MESYIGRFMNTTFSLKVSDDVDKGWKEQMRHWLEYVDREWSRFRAGNELDQLNQAPKGIRLQCSPPLYDVLVMAERYRRLTSGRFSPYLKRAMEHQGYARSFPFPYADVKEAFMFQLEEHPVLFHGSYTLEKNTDQQLDLGGIAKGYAVQSAAEWLKRHGATYGMVDGGGDMSLWSDGTKAWEIGIADPWEETRVIDVLSLKNKAVATSNRLYRSWQQGKDRKHHLLDGRTGKSVQTKIVQSTVIASQCVDAEVCAKICFLLKEEEHEEWFARHFPSVSYVLVDEDGKVKTNIKGEGRR